MPNFEATFRPDKIQKPRSSLNPYQHTWNICVLTPIFLVFFIIVAKIDVADHEEYDRETRQSTIQEDNYVKDEVGFGRDDAPQRQWKPYGRDAFLMLS